MTKFTLKSVTGEQGVTLVELLIYIAIVGVVMGAIYTMFYRQQDSYLVQDRLALLQQNLRGAMTVLANDIQMAGHYTCYEQRPISVLGDSRPILAGGSSSITIYKVDRAAKRALVPGESADTGTKAITVNNDLGFDTGTNKYGVLIKSDLNRAEFFEVRTLGNPLNVYPAADASITFVESYFGFASVEQSDKIAPVEIITYTLDGDNRLWRSGEMVAEHITGLQFSYAVVDDVVGEAWVDQSAKQHLDPGDKPDMKAWDARDVRRVEVTLTGDIQLPQKLVKNRRTERTLSSTIKVRNLGMEAL